MMELFTRTQMIRKDRNILGRNSKQTKNLHLATV